VVGAVAAPMFAVVPNMMGRRYSAPGASGTASRLRQGQQARALQQALHVPVHAKNMHRTVGMAERLESLETRARVVQHVRRGTDFDRSDGLDIALAPLAVTIIRDRHVGREQGAERRSLRLRGHEVFTVGMKMVAGCSRRSFNAWIIAAAS
jgi:hypothetical protein